MRALPAVTLAVLASGPFSGAGAGAAASLLSPELIVGQHHPPRPALPDYLEGRPEKWQVRSEMVKLVLMLHCCATVVVEYG